MSYQILLVEDTPPVKELVLIALGAGYDITWASNLSSAQKFVDEKEFDLILLDVELPDGDGFRFFSLLLVNPNYKNVPVMFLTVKDNLSDKVLGFSLGAEDYIVKPFEEAELKARVDMRLKKYNTRKEDMRLVKKKELELHLDAQRAFIKDENVKHDMDLTPLEFKLLAILSTNEDRIFTRNQLLDKLWGESIHLTDRTIDTHIYSLRKKMGKFSIYIQAIYGEGYRFSGELSTQARLRKSA